MNDKVSEWEGHAVIGNVNELDAIISSTGQISVDKKDIMNILDLDGDSYIVTGTGDSIEKAIELAISYIPCHRWQVVAMAIVMWFGTAEVNMQDVDSLTKKLSLFRSNEKLVWGIYHDSALGNSYKVAIVASTNIKYSEWRKFFSDLRKESRTRMYKRHAFLSDIVKDYTSLDDFAREKREFPCRIRCNASKGVKEC